MTKRDKSVLIDGTLYVAVQMLTFLSVSFSQDESAKYISPALLFWIKIIIGELTAGFFAVKIFRSTQFADAKSENKEEADKANK